jgi:isochorismate synthase EntC
MGYTPAGQRESWKKAAQIRAAHAAAVQALQARRDLSAAGRQRQLASLHVAVRDKLAELREQDQQAVAEQRRQLTDALFRGVGRTPATAVAERDALTRAQSITTPDDAYRMLQDAQQVDDPGWSRAVARRAAQLHGQSSGPDRDRWNKVVEGWANSSHAPPFAKINLSELADIHAEQNDLMTRMAADEMYRPTTPPELRDQAHRVDRLAAEADDTTDVRPPSHAEQVGRQLASRAIAD